MPLVLVRKEGRIPWYLRGTVNGKRYDESTKTADKDIAEAKRIKREHELQLEGVHGKAVTKTFSQAVLHYLEHGGARLHIKPLLLHFGDMALWSIGQEQIDAAALKLKPKASPATRIRQIYTPMSAVLMSAARLGWCPRPLIKRPKLPPSRIRWITHAEAERLLAACSEHLRPLLTFLLYTGARCGEALWLDWSKIDLDRKVVWFEETKNGSSRGVPLHDRVIEELRKVNNRTGPVFRRPDGEPYTPLDPDDDWDMSAGTRIKTAFKGACTRAGIENFHPHDCRHTWATWHYIANRNVASLMYLGGWKTMALVMRYTHVNVDDLAATIGNI